jgi:hypothetical protein
MTKAENPQINWHDLLFDAVSEPGKLQEAFRYFHSYSLGNMIAIETQCRNKGIELGPVATYKRWQTLGRQVTKGAKSLWMCQPVTIKDKDADETDENGVKVFFQWRPGWFVLSQTEGEDQAEAITCPQWDAIDALKALDITREPFAHHNGNVQGYATRKRTIAINPVAQLPVKTLFHELAHIVLGHTDVESHGFDTPKSLKEVEAESVALLCTATLGLEGVEYCRGYIQHWGGEGNTIPEKSAQAIFRAADKIIKAGLITEKKAATIEDAKAVRTQQPVAQSLPQKSAAPAATVKGIRERHGVASKERAELCQSLIKAHQAATLLNQTSGTGTAQLEIKYGTTTYKVPLTTEAIERLISKLGFTHKLNESRANHRAA